MRSHAKASTAGSTQRQATGLGRIFRGAFATRGDSHASKGSGASKARRLVLPAAVLALVLAFAVPQASALKFHAFKEVFGSAAQPSFETRSMAIDQSTGDILVMDKTGGTSTVKRFNPDGTPHNFSALATNTIDGEGGPDTTPQNGLGFGGLGESQIAVDNSGTATDGNIYVTQGSPNLINVFSSTGAYLGQLTAAGATNFSEACGVAVDSAGAVYVGDYTSGIHKFVPAVNPPVNADHTATFTTTSEPCTLAAGVGPSAGFLFPAQYQGPISKIDSATGELKYTIVSGSHVTVAVDPGTGHVYGLGSGPIEERDASGAASPGTVSNTTVEGDKQGLAVRGSSGDIYYAVSPSTTNKIQVLSGAMSTSPDVATTAATGITDSEATLNGTVNPDGQALSECLFEWGLTTNYGNTAPCVPSPAGIGSGTSPVAVSAAISGLDVATVYHFRLKAANANGPVFGSDETLQSAGPRILDSWAEDVLYTEAKLRAEINPEEAATTYRVEYGPTTAYGSESAELNVGSDSSVHTVSFLPDDLQPSTTYHWRVVATSGAGENEGPDHEIRTFRRYVAKTDCPNQANRYGAGANLPDCRAYELVSPLDKNGGDIKSLAVDDGTAGYIIERRVQSTPSGDRLTYSSYRAFADAQSVPHSSQYIAQRIGGTGWLTHSINQPGGAPVVSSLNATRAQYQVFSENLCHGWMKTYFDSPSLEMVPGLPNVHRFDDRLCGPERFEALAPIVAPLSLGEFPQPFIHGVSADGSHTIFAISAKLVPEAAADRYQLYESYEPGAPPRLVCILPGGEAWFDNCVAGGGYLEPREGLRTGAISEDGERIFWTNSLGIEGEIYVRIGGTETLAVSQAGEEAAGTTKSWFWGAANDGSRAIYTTGHPADAGRSHLYAFDVDGEATEPIATGVYGVAGISEDAKRIYFVSEDELPESGQNSRGEEAIADQLNLYLYDANAGTYTFIATLSNEDFFPGNPAGANSPVARTPRGRLARVTPDGLHLAFGSKASLTGYDNKAGTTGFINYSAYLYDAVSDELICASCNPSGARGERESDGPENSLGVTEFVRARPLPPVDNPLQPSRILSEDGSRLFFETIHALDPRDSNGQVDVYQWEAEGAGGCDAGDSRFAPSAAGCIELISTGTSDFESEFAEASVTGDDVFIYTNSGLVPSDYGLRDIYDARIGGGLPLPPEAPECVGDACQGIPPAPNDPTPASAGFRGAGDPAPRKAQRRCCRARVRKGAKGSSNAKHKKAKRCRRNNGRAGR